MFHVGSKLDLCLDSCELTGFIKRDRMGPFSMSSLAYGRKKHREGREREEERERESKKEKEEREYV